MIYSDFKAFQPATSSSLGLGYVYTPSELVYLTASGSNAQIRNFPFGTSPKDSVEFYVYTLDGQIITSSYIEPKDAPQDPDDYTAHTHSYTDVTNNSVVYSYTSYESDFSIVGTATQSLILNVSKVLTDLGVSEGNYTVGILPVRNVVGKANDATQRLIVDEISPSRLEVAVIPHSKPITTDSNEQVLNDEFKLFSYSKIKPKLIVDRLLGQIQTPQLYSIYNTVATLNPDADSFVKYYYAFKTSADLVGFITDIYYGVQKGALKNNGQLSSKNVFGIFDQTKNFLYQNYETITSFQEVRDYYYSLMLYILDIELNQITNKKPAEYSKVEEFFRQIFYDLIFFPAISSTESDYQTYFSGYLKNSMNFGGGILLPILNYQVSPSSNPAVSDRLILKLKDPLPMDVVAGDSFWISCTTISTPIVQPVYFYSNVTASLYQVRGPNFSHKMENEGSGTENLSLDTIMGSSGSLNDQISSSLAYKSNIQAPLNTDYRYFENFIRFSSATTRIQIYSEKVSMIDSIRSQIADLDSKLSLNPTDEFYLTERSNLDAQWNQIENSFDGYETFLLANPDWYAEHTAVYDSVSSSSLFDEENRGSLQNNLPEYIAGEPANVEYVTFVNMIGHYFDNLMLYIDQFTEKNNASNSETQGISKDVVYDMLTSLGWDPEMGRENLPLLLTSFSKDDFDVDSELWNKVGDMSENDRSKFIWKRILNNLPFILKAKGTEAAINALINCYGIPRNIVQIREYGGIDYSTEVNNESLFIFDETKYAPYFSGSAEYFKLPWSGSVQSVEFNFTFDTSNISPAGTTFRLANADNRWVIGIVREKGNDWGRAFFSIQDTGSSLITFSTPRAPLFDGNTYSLLLRKYDVSTDFNLSTSASSAITDPYPQEYELVVKRNEDSRTTFQVNAFAFLSGSYNTSFRSASYAYFGNYNQDTASLGVDPDAFFGTIDEIRLWELPLSDDQFNSHASYRGSYNLDDPRDVVSNLLTRVSFTTPTDLYVDSADRSLELPNDAFKTSNPVFWAVHFPMADELVLQSEDCQTFANIPLYPYQFEKLEMIQSVKLPNFGANKFKSNKIKFKNQKLVSNLSPDGRSTQKANQDSDIDSNKLGIFFSPGELINTEIIKFFGNFQMGDLIGKPNDVYEKTYSLFDQFRKVFYNQGGGQVDYQTFMNLVRMYFDKSLFKYIKNLVPARTKLVEGLMIEPTILERPKLQLKPLHVSVPNNLIGSVAPTNRILESSVVGLLTQSLSVSTSGKSTWDDVNRLFYSDSVEPYGFVIAADNGIAFYNNDYYRVDILQKTGSVIVNQDSRPSLSGSYDSTSSFVAGSSTSATSSYDAQGNGPDRGKYYTMKKHWSQINISRLPILLEIPPSNSRQNLKLSTIDDTSLSANKKTLFNFTGSMTFSSGSGLSSQYAPIILDGIVTAPNIISGSLSGSILTQIGLRGTIYAGTASLGGTYDYVNHIFSGSILLTNSATFSGSFYSLDSNKSAIDYLVPRTNGNVFVALRDSELGYRKSLSLLNVPYNSRSLNGYYSTHYRYKNPLFRKKTVKLLDNGANSVGTFKMGSQTQQTTVQSGTGLRDNSLPIVITKTT